MPKFTFAAISLDDLKSFIHLHEGFIGNYEWNQTDSIVLTEHEQQRVTEVSTVVETLHATSLQTNSL